MYQIPIKRHRKWSRNFKLDETWIVLTATVTLSSAGIQAQVIDTNSECLNTSHSKWFYWRISSLVQQLSYPTASVAQLVEGRHGKPWTLPMFLQGLLCMRGCPGGIFLGPQLGETLTWVLVWTWADIADISQGAVLMQELRNVVVLEWSSLSGSISGASAW